jgi:ABC-type uncharacterized transport system ATPase subunit
MIEIAGLTKRYGDKTAVDGLSFVVEPGVATGFLGPNGAGKSTTGQQRIGSLHLGSCGHRGDTSEAEDVTGAECGPVTLASPGGSSL